MSKGKIIVIDGMDGTGKQTQSELVYKKLKKKYESKVKLFSFPNYEDDSSYFVKKYLKEGYCRDIETNCDILHSSFFSIDRFISFEKYLRDLYENGYIIILDRYTISNAIFNVKKSDADSVPRYENFIYKLRRLENDIFNLPVADVNILLYSDPKVSDKLMDKRNNNDDSKRDLNENLDFQQCVYNHINILYQIGQKQKKEINECWENYDEIDEEVDIGPIEKILIHDEDKELYPIEYINGKIMYIIETALE